MHTRRAFVGLLGAAGFALLLPKAEETDSYSLFLSDVRRRVCRIVRQEGRGIHRMEIGPPVDGFRQCRLHLVAGPSLLDRVAFTWYEPWTGDQN
jgi:hypothetical protein